jgi:chromosome segregation ATPase
MVELRRENASLNSDLNQIKEAALSAIMDKDATITELTERLDEFQHNESANELKSAILELEDKYRELEDRSEVSKNELTALIEEKDVEINELQERIAQLKDKHEERSSRLEQEILDL